jgi:hypothetical protein
VLRPPVSLAERERLDVIIGNQFVLPVSAAGLTLGATIILHLLPRTRLDTGRPYQRYPDQAMLHHHGVGTAPKAVKVILADPQLGLPHMAVHVERLERRTATDSITGVPRQQSIPCSPSHHGGACGSTEVSSRH